MIIVLSVLIAVLLLALGFAIRKLNQMKHQLREQEVQHALKQQEIKDDMVSSQVEYLEEEIQRIGADVHDDLIQRLSEQMLYVEQLTWVEDIEHAQALAIKLKTNFRFVVSSVREISNTLLPSSIDSPSLVAALKDLSSKMEVPGVAYVSVESNGTEFKLDLKHQVHLVRIVQELVHNATKHSVCWHVWIRLTWTGHVLIIEVEDDGMREEESEKRFLSSRGFRTIRMRLRFIGGQLSFEKGVRGLKAIVRYPDNSGVQIIPLRKT